MPSLNKMLVLELASCEWSERRDNVIALGPSGTDGLAAGGGQLSGIAVGASICFIGSSLQSPSTMKRGAWLVQGRKRPSPSIDVTVAVNAARQSLSSAQAQKLGL